ncbi:hypothetical protein [Microbacterium xylanilyticum]
MSEQLTDLFGRVVNPPQPTLESRLRSVPQPKPEPVPPVDGHAMTAQVLRPSGNTYAAPIHMRVCECGRTFESSDMRVAQNLADMHLADPTLPERIARSEAEKPARIDTAQRI